MLTKETRVDSIEILPDGTIVTRYATVILDDGQVFGEPVYRVERHRPGSDVTQADARVQKVADAVWTAEVVSDANADAAKLDG